MRAPARYESPSAYFRKLLRNAELAELAAAWAWFIGVEHALPPMGVRMWIKQQIGRHPFRSAYPAWVDPAFESRTDLRARWTQLSVDPEPVRWTRPRASRLLLIPNWWALFERYDAGVIGLPIEARHSLIDRRLVEYILDIPPVPWSIAKHILRAAMVGALPETVRTRPKTLAAGDVVAQLLREPRWRWLDDFEPSAKLVQYVRRDTVPRIAGESDSNRLWVNIRPLILNRWLERSASVPPDAEAYDDSQTQDRCFKPN